MIESRQASTTAQHSAAHRLHIERTTLSPAFAPSLTKRYHTTSDAVWPARFSTGLETLLSSTDSP